MAGAVEDTRLTCCSAVSKNDKDVIRSRLLESALQEQDARLALQNALVIAKIARFEYPHDWRDVLSSLANALRSQLPPLQLARALLVLLHIVKELSTGRLQRTRQNMQAATPEIVHVLGTLYVSLVESWSAYLPPETQQQMEQSLLALKVLRRLLVSGYEHPNRDSEVSAFWALTQQHLAIFMQLEQQGHANMHLLQKHMIQLAKLHHTMAQDHPAAFALLPRSLDLVAAYWSAAKRFGDDFGSKEAVVSAVTSASIGTDGDAANEKSSAERLTLKGLLIVRACVKMVHTPATTFKYRTPDDKEERSRATETIRQTLLNQAFVQEVMETLVMKFFVFRLSDLKEWEEEPEEWEKREEGEGEDWEFSVRSCSEKLFLDLAIHYKHILVQPLLRVFYSVADADNDSVLFKDSVYTAIGLAAPVVHEHLDFDAFVRDVLAPEVQKQTPGFGIIRRRASILLGQWISVKMAPETRPLVYEIFQHLLNKDQPLNDQVVRVTAGRQLKNICDDWGFTPDQFLPYAETILRRLMQLIEEVELAETKMALLNTISVVVERLDHAVAPFAGSIVSMLPSLWEASGEEHLMKQAILTILARLVNAMKADSLPMHPMVFPIIKGAVEPGSETEVYLLDDAMDLWAAILVQTPSPASQELLGLVPYLYPIFELGSDNLRKALEITESYVLLAPEHVLSAGVRISLFTALSNLLGALRPDANGLVCNLLELVLRAAEKLGGETAVIQTTDDLVQTGVLKKLLEGLRGSWTAHCTTGPLKKDPPVDGIVETDYFAILARLILGSLEGFCQACQHAAPADTGTTDLASTMKWLLEEWFGHLENVGDPSRKKLMSLALTKLLQTNQSFILLNLQSLMTIWTDVITELREGAEDTSGDSLVYSNTDAGPPTDGTIEAPEDARGREMMYSDVVHTVGLPEFVKECLEGAIAAAGGGGVFQEDWLGNVDRDVVQGFSALGVM